MATCKHDFSCSVCHGTCKHCGMSWRSVLACVQGLEREVARLTNQSKVYEDAVAEWRPLVLERIPELEREVARLRGFAQHKPNCDVSTGKHKRGSWDDLVLPGDCTCGLG